MPRVCVPVKCKLWKMSGNVLITYIYVESFISTSLRLFHQGIDQAACLWNTLQGIEASGIARNREIIQS